MQGKEVSVETLSVDGKCTVVQITDKLTTGAPHFVEMGHSEPSMHSEEIIKKIKQVAIEAVNSIGIKDGPSHTEIMITEEGPKIVELGARLGGDCITTHLVPLSTGVNMVENCILIALGLKPNLNAKFNKGSAIRFIPSKKGIIKSISGKKEAESIQGVMEVRIDKQVGDQVTDIENSVSRIGFVIAQNENNLDAIKTCEFALEKLRIDIE